MIRLWSADRSVSYSIQLKPDESGLLVEGLDGLELLSAESPIVFDDENYIISLDASALSLILDGSFLRLDTSNDPLTGTLNIVGGGIVASGNINASNLKTSTGQASVSVGEQSNNPATGFNNSVIGFRAGATLTVNSSTYIGSRAGELSNFGNNTFIGAEAGRSYSGNDTVLIGHRAGFTGSGNATVAIGRLAGQNATAGSSTYIGAFSGTANAGDRVTLIGRGAGQNNTTGPDLTAVGVNAGQLNTTGRRNSAFGVQAMQQNQTGEHNSWMGVAAGIQSRGNDNTGVGYQAGFNQRNGNNNTFLGSGADTNNLTGSYRTAIGSGAIATANNQIVLGRPEDQVLVPGSLASLGPVTAPNFNWWGPVMTDLGTITPGSTGAQLRIHGGTNVQVTGSGSTIMINTTDEAGDVGQGYDTIVVGSGAATTGGSLGSLDIVTSTSLLALEINDGGTTDTLFVDWVGPAHWFTAVEGDSGPVRHAGLTSDTLRVIGGTDIETAVNESGELVVTYVGSGGGGQPDQDLFRDFLGDTGTASPSSPTDSFTFSGSEHISTSISGNILTITYDGPTTFPGLNQNALTTILGDSGLWEAESPESTFQIFGGESITTSVVGDSVFIDFTGTPTTTTIWQTFVADEGSVAAANQSDALAIVGGTHASTSIVGKILTVDVDDLELTEAAEELLSVDGFELDVVDFPPNQFLSGPTSGVLSLKPTVRPLVLEDIPLLPLSQISDAGTMAGESATSYTLTTALGVLAFLDDITLSLVTDSGTMAAEAAADYTPTSGLGTMAFADTADYTATSGLGDLAFLDNITLSLVTDSGTMAAEAAADYPLTSSLGNLAFEDTVSLATEVSGVLPIANGGTGAATWADRLALLGPTTGGPLAPTLRAITLADVSDAGTMAAENAADYTASASLGNLALLDTITLSLITDAGTMAGETAANYTPTTGLGTMAFEAAADYTATNDLGGLALQDTVSLTTEVTGVLPIASGGTGAATWTDRHALLGPTTGGPSAPSIRAITLADVSDAGTMAGENAADYTATTGLGSMAFEDTTSYTPTTGLGGLAFEDESALNIWKTFSGDTGSATASTFDGTLTVAGGTDISTAVTGSTLTINYTGAGGGGAVDDAFKTITVGADSVVASGEDTVTLVGTANKVTIAKTNDKEITFGVGDQVVQSDSDGRVEIGSALAPVLELTRDTASVAPVSAVDLVANLTAGDWSGNTGGPSIYGRIDGGGASNNLLGELRFLRDGNNVLGAMSLVPYDDGTPVEALRADRLGRVSVNESLLISTEYMNAAAPTFGWPVARLRLAEDGSGTNRAAIAATYGGGNSIAAGTLRLESSNGTLLSKTNRNNGDNIGRIIFSGWSGGAARDHSEIRSVVDGTATGTSMPHRLEFLTGAGTPGVRLRIKSGGDVEVVGALDVGGQVSVTNDLLSNRLFMGQFASARPEIYARGPGGGTRFFYGRSFGSAASPSNISNGSSVFSGVYQAYSNAWRTIADMDVTMVSGQATASPTGRITWRVHNGSGLQSALTLESDVSTTVHGDLSVSGDGDIDGDLTVDGTISGKRDVASTASPTASMSGAYLTATSINLPNNPPAGTWFTVEGSPTGTTISSSQNMVGWDGSGTGETVSLINSASFESITLLYNGSVWRTTALVGTWASEE